MKPYFLFSLVFGTFVSLFLFRIWTENSHFSFERAGWQASREQAENYNENSPSHVIFGTSRAMALNPSLLKDKTGKDFLNLSVGGGNLAQVYFALQKITKTGHKPEHVYIELTRYTEVPGWALDLNGTLGERLIRWYLTRTEAKELDEIFPGSYHKWKETRINGSEYFTISTRNAFQRTKDIVFSQHSEKVLKETLKNTGGFFLFGEMPHIKNTGSGQTYDLTEVTSNSYGKNAGHWATAWDIEPTTDWAMRNILNLLRNEEINYTFFLSPVSDHRVQNTTDDLAFGHLPWLLAQVPKKQMKNNILILGAEDFTDWSHTNWQGAQKFADFFAHYVFANQPAETFNNPKGVYTLNVPYNQ